MFKFLSTENQIKKELLQSTTLQSELQDPQGFSKCILEEIIQSNKFIEYLYGEFDDQNTMINIFNTCYSK